MKNFKLRVYKLDGPDKGNIDHEEFFETVEQMDKRYNELFRKDEYGYNATAWIYTQFEWCRICGY